MSAKNHEFFRTYELVPDAAQIYPLKCDVCGSTAIDHTEMQCQINRRNNKTKAQPERQE